MSKPTEPVESLETLADWCLEQCNRYTSDSKALVDAHEDVRNYIDDLNDYAESLNTRLTAAEAKTQHQAEIIKTMLSDLADAQSKLHAVGLLIR